jgi:hypothetical protein
MSRQFRSPLHDGNNNNNNNNNNNVKANVIPVIIGATGTISKSFRKYVSKIPGKHEIKQLQKTAILGTAHIIRKVLTYKYNRFNTETNDISTMNSNNRTAATLYSLAT